VRGWTATQTGLVAAASFRTWPGWRGAYPRQPLDDGYKALYKRHQVL